MSTVTDPKPASAPPTATAPLAPVALGAAPQIVLNGEVHIPPGIVDLESFRRWTHSADFPTRGRIDYLDGVIWVDVTMEQIYTHACVKGEFGVVVGGLVRTMDTGLFLPDGARLVIPAVGLSTETDTLFVSYDRLENGQVREIPGSRGGVLELEGTPDMVLEIVSDSSVEKDTERLPELYRQAGLPELWLVDVRAAMVRFEILHLIEGLFQPMAEADGWWRSAVFSRSFRLTAQVDRRGQPRFVLDVRP